MRTLDVGQIPGYEEYAGRYIVYEDGRVYGVKKKDFLVPRKTEYGYWIVDFNINGNITSKHVKISRLVALAFIPNPQNLPQVGHNDENKDNNDISNLYWTDAKENNNHGTHNRKLGKAVYCVELDRVFETMSAAARELHLHVSNISNCVKDSNRRTGGYHWRLANEEEINENY